jgi:hypothetical protein
MKCTLPSKIEIFLENLDKSTLRKRQSKRHTMILSSLTSKANAKLGSSMPCGILLAKSKRMGSQFQKAPYFSIEEIQAFYMETKVGEI